MKRFSYAVDRRDSGDDGDSWVIAAFMKPEQRDAWVSEQRSGEAKAIERSELKHYFGPCEGGNMIRCMVPNHDPINTTGTPPPFIVTVMHRKDVDSAGGYRLNGRRKSEREEGIFPAVKNFKYRRQYRIQRSSK